MPAYYWRHQPRFSSKSYDSNSIPKDTASAYNEVPVTNEVKETKHISYIKQCSVKILASIKQLIHNFL